MEGIIQENIGGFYEVGHALAKIRDQGYYRDVLGFETFEAYCKARWDFGRRTAYQYIDAAKTIENVRHGAQSDVVPVNERQCRPLIKIKDPEVQLIAWQKAVSDRSGNNKASRQWRSFNLGHRRKPSPVKPGRAIMPEPGKGLDENPD